MSKKVAIDQATVRTGSRYPAPFDKPCQARVRTVLGDAAGLTQFGVNLLRLPPGSWSSQRHWHSAEDEFIYILEGEVILVTNSGEEILRAGDCAGFKAGEADGHHLQNQSSRDAVILEIGTRRPEADATVYSDIDLLFPEQSEGPERSKGYTHRDGTPYLPTE